MLILVTAAIFLAVVLLSITGCRVCSTWLDPSRRDMVPPWSMADPRLAGRGRARPPAEVPKGGALCRHRRSGPEAGGEGPFDEVTEDRRGPARNSIASRKTGEKR
ncbi:hypothetical protein GCM10027521_32770 [Amycolatopsis cihanbeyliensis]